MMVYPVKHSPLLRQPEHFIARDELKALVQKVTHNLVNIKDETGEFLLRLDDGRVIDTKGWAGWEWTHGVGLYGMYHYYQQTGDQTMRKIIDDWFADRFAEGATTKNVNTMAPFLTLAYRYEETRNPAYLPWLETWAEWAMNEMPRTDHGGMQHITLAEENHQQMWDDTLMMTVLPLAKIGKLLNRTEYVEEATYQFLLHVQNLMDKETGLWFHGWSYVGRHYAQVAEKAIRGIVKHISPEGELLQTSFGTGMGHDLDFYRHIPLTSMPYGQAMAMLCLTEYLRNYF